MSRATALSVVVIAAIGFAWAMPLASVGCARSAHYAATRSIAEGHPYIDRYANTTCDLVRTNGHYYAAKGPALELWSAPFYLLLRSFGAVPANPNAHLSYPDAMAGIPLRAVWQIGLWAVVLPAIGLLLLIRRAVEWIEPGLGTAAAAILGLATLMLPFYAIRQAPRLRRLALFAAGGLVGLLPLLAFDTWAFGNPLRLAYAGTPDQVQPAAGRPRVPRPRPSELPHSGRVAAESARTARAHAGRRGRSSGLRASLAARAPLRGRVDRRARRCRAHLELGPPPDCVRARRLGAWTAVPDPTAAVPRLRARSCVAACARNRRRARAHLRRCDGRRNERRAAAPERRHAPLALANRARQLHGDGRQPRRGRARLARDHSVLCARARCRGDGDSRDPLPVSRRDLAMAGAAVAAWIVVEHGAPELLRVDRLVHQSWGLIAAIGLVAAAAWAVIRLRPEGLLLVPFATVRFDDHTKWALLPALLALAALALHGRVRHPLGPA